MNKLKFFLVQESFNHNGSVQQYTIVCAAISKELALEKLKHHYSLHLVLRLEHIIDVDKEISSDKEFIKGVMYVE